MSGPENETPKQAPAATPRKAAAPKSTASPKASEPVATKSASGASTTQATAAMGNAVNIVRERLVAGEQLVLSGAGLVVAVWAIFNVIFDYGIIREFSLLVAVLAVLAVWVHRWGHYDFGTAYRVVIGALGLSLALFAVFNFLAIMRSGINAEALQLLGLLLFWVGGVVAGYGAWLVFRVREE